MDNNNKEIKSLNQEIALVQLEKIVKDFDKSMSSLVRKDMKRAIIFILPFTVGSIASIITLNPIFISIGTSVMALGAISLEISKAIKKNPSKKKNRMHGNIINFPKEEEIEEDFKKGIINKRGSDFYTDEFKEFLSSSYEPQVELKLCINNQRSLNKDETMIQIKDEMDIYAHVYKLPDFNILPADWQNFFDFLYAEYLKEGIVDHFYESMSEISRIVFAKSLVNKSRSISILDFIDNLYYLESEGLNKMDIIQIQKLILEQMQIKKTVDIQNYQKVKKINQF